MKNYIIEFIGTFFLVLVIGLAGNSEIGAGAMAPVAIGSVLMVMVYMGGHLSGAHYNPAITIAVLLRGKIQKNDAVMYILFQIMGGLAAALVHYLIFRYTFAPAPNAEINIEGIRILKPFFVEA